MKKYYEAYEDRYKTAHEKGVSWSSSQPSGLIEPSGRGDSAFGVSGARLKMGFMCRTSLL